MRSARARKRDSNEAEIVDAFRARGCSVTRIDGDGVPDLLVGHAGRTLLVEVKRPKGPRGGVHHDGHVGSHGDFKPAQVKWWKEWCGESPVCVRTVADVEQLLAEDAQLRHDALETHAAISARRRA